MRVPVTLGPDAHAPAVEYRWDADTDILTARIAAPGRGAGLTGSIEVEGADGSWLIFDVRGGEIAGVEVAVWPDVAIVPTLDPPTPVSGAGVSIPSRPSQPGVAALEIDTQLSARADERERTVHFRIGAPHVATTVRAGTDLLLDLDDARHIVGVWMLNVPPFPSGT